MSATADSPLAQAVAELEALFAHEAGLLKRLDHSTLEEIASKKLELAERIGQELRAHPLPEHAELLQRLRQGALRNQLLLLHARDTMRGLVDVLSRGRSTGQLPLRVDMRG